MKADYRQGDYRVIAERLRPAAEALVAWTRPRGLVVDVAAGTGNVAHACRVAGATVIATDLVPEQLARGRSTYGEDIAWVAADATALPVRDGVADAVLSTFGVIYVQDVKQVLGELRRVARPGAVIGLSTWPLGGYQDASAAALSAALGTEYGDGHVRRWGEEAAVAEHLRSVADDVQVRRGVLRSRYPSLEAWWQLTAEHAPPLVMAAAELTPARFTELGEALRDVARRFGHVTADAFELADEYLLARGRLR